MLKDLIKDMRTLKYLSYVLGGFATIMMFAGGVGPGLGILAGVGSAFCFLYAKKNAGW
jgi:hypothetical protein